MAPGGRGGGRRGGQGVRGRPARRRDAGLGGRQASAAGQDSPSQTELEAEAKAKAAAEQPARAKVDEKPPRKPPPAAAPEPKAQRNFTDPESRILRTKDGYIQGYNAQAAVDTHAQIIVAHTLGNNGSDQNQFAPLLSIWAAIRTKYRPMQATARPPIFAR